MVKTQRFHCCDPGLVPGWGAKIPTWPKKKRERERDGASVSPKISFNV